MYCRIGFSCLDVVSELSVIKNKMKKNYIHVWSKLIGLCDSSEYTLEMSSDVAVDRLFYLLSHKHIQIYDVITDLLHAAQAHILA